MKVSGAMFDVNGIQVIFMSDQSHGDSQGFSAGPSEFFSASTADKAKGLQNNFSSDEIFWEIYPVSCAEESEINNLFALPNELLLTRGTETEEERQEFIGAHIDIGLELMESFNSSDHLLFERVIDQDPKDLEVFKKSFHCDLLSHLDELGIEVDDIKELFIEPVPVFAGLLATLGLSSRLWYKHAVNPRSVFNYVLSQL